MKLLYVSAANVIQPTSGMDVVCQAHLLELLDAKELSIDAVTVSPGVTESVVPGVYLLQGIPVHVFVGDQKHEKPGLARFFSKLMMVVSRCVPVMAYSFKSVRAREYLGRLLDGGQYDCVVVDHLYSFSNIGWFHILRSGSKFVYISHDHYGAHVFDMARLSSGLLRKIYLYLECVRLSAVERVIFGFADLIIHLSEFEFSAARARGGRHAFLLPALKSEGVVKNHTRRCEVRLDLRFGYVLFVGSPSHFPNAQAIDWMIHELSPVLLKIAPLIKICLVGEGTDRLSLPSNVVGYGFVRDIELEVMLADCLCAISPVASGGGVKVKIIKSIEAGCPVLATPYSLRGLEAFGIKPRVDLGNPVGVAQYVLRLFTFPAEREAARREMRDHWRVFLAGRENGLLRQLKAVVGRE